MSNLIENPDFESSIDAWTQQCAPQNECYDTDMSAAVVIVLAVLLAALVHPLFLLLLLLLLVA